MRTKPIRRDEIRFNGIRVTTLPIDSVATNKWGDPVPIKRLWAPLLRALSRQRQRVWAKNEKVWRPLREEFWGRKQEAKPPGPVRCPQPYHGACQCRHCGREFFRVRVSGRAFCSDRCAGATRSVKQSRAVAAARAAARADRACEVCGATLDARRSSKRFCSPRCRMAGHRQAPVRARKGKKPLPDCPLCEGSGLQPGLWNFTTACGLPTGLNNVRLPCSCLTMRRRGNPTLYADLARERKAFEEHEETNK